MQKNLRVTMVQSNVKWEDPIGNLKRYIKLFSGLKTGGTDLIILPEMFNTGFTMNASALAETTGGPTMQWMSECASALQSVVCGSLIIKDGKRFYNRFIWMLPDGSYDFYDKRHLFSMAGEHKVYTRGTESILFEYKGWRVCPQICYDLRFPVWSRNRIVKDEKQLTPEYDVLLYVANWPAVRRFAWQQLLSARAIENQCYVIGVNRIGKDGNDYDYKGDSSVINCFGEKISSTRSATSVETVALDAKILSGWRKKFPVLMDADVFNIK